MVHNESQFKVEFRKALELSYGEKVKVWPTNDMFRAGVPDFNATYDGKYYSIEAKFAKALPSRMSSQVLEHSVSLLQVSHLQAMNNTGSFGFVLVGCPDVAVFAPIERLITSASGYNITKEALIDLDKKGLSFVRGRKGWRVDQFFEIVRKFYGR
jgi:penicillin-binding protein-related factor A (putative recombinase)